MGFWDSVVVIFIVGAVIWLRAQKYRAQGTRPIASPPPQAIGRETGAEREIADLRRRIAVLERIATDDSKEADLARRINALRD